MRLVKKTNKFAAHSIALLCVMALFGCNDAIESNSTESTENQTLSLDMELPNSLTGGSASSTVAAASGGAPCWAFYSLGGCQDINVSTVSFDSGRKFSIPS